MISKTAIFLKNESSSFIYVISEVITLNHYLSLSIVLIVLGEEFFLCKRKLSFIYAILI